MRFFDILKYPDIKLRRKAKPLSPGEVTKNVSLIKDIVCTMYNADGLGLAATQVGVDKRIIAIDTKGKEDKSKIFSPRNILKDNNILYSSETLIVAVNPEIIFKEGKSVHEEGCLSIPKFHADIERADNIKIKFLDLSGRETVMDAQGLLSIAFQHEIDHLDGVLFIDKAPPLKRSLYNATLKKNKSKKREKDIGYTS